MQTNKFVIMVFSQVSFERFIWPCTIVAILIGFTSGIELTLSESHHERILCPEMDTCRSRSHEDLYSEHSCSCAPYCVTQENCCIDSPYVNSKPSELKATCNRVYGSQRSVLMITRCKNSWSGENDIKELCEGSSWLIGNPIEVVPVTNQFTGVTYKNYFCARCNNDNTDVILWDVEVSTDLPEWEIKALPNDSFPRVVQYDRNSSRWVYRRPENRDDVRFVNLVIYKPKDLSQLITECELDIGMQCPPEWNGPDIKTKCESYTALIVATWTDKHGYGFRKLFRNVNCAICNGVTDFSDAICNPFYEKPPTRPVFTPRPIPRPTFPPGRQPSVTVWFGHLLYDRSCLRGEEIYVERLRGCRTIVCLKPKHVIRNRRCVPP